MLELKSIRLRLVEESDADFILSLRMDNRYNMFLSKVDGNIDSQKAWIRAYKEDEIRKKQFYFIIERLDGVRCGTVRLYDFRDNSFSWGSWILNENKTRYAAIETALLVYEFGFTHLGFNQSHFEVMKENLSVLKFHKRFGAVEIGSDDINIYFSVDKDTVDLKKDELLGLIL